MAFGLIFLQRCQPEVLRGFDLAGAFRHLHFSANAANDPDDARVALAKPTGKRL
jgi:hypothetical protein